MNAGAGDFADSEEARDGGAAPDVGAHAAHPVVCSRGDGDGLLDQSRPRARQAASMVGKRWARKAAPSAGGVEHDRLAILRGHLAGDAAGDDVARGELGAGMNVSA